MERYQKLKLYNPKRKRDCWSLSKVELRKSMIAVLFFPDRSFTCLRVLLFSMRFTLIREGMVFRGVMIST